MTSTVAERGPTECYAMVRGSAIRVTGLDSRGALLDPSPYAVSKSVATVRINEVTDAGSSEILRNPEDDRRLRLSRSTKTIRYTVDIDFIRVDPELIALLTGARLVYRGHKIDEGFGGEAFGGEPFGDELTTGFGGMPYGIGYFGGPSSDVIGFDATSRMPAKSFGLEVWSKLAGEKRIKPVMLGFDEMPFDTTPFGTSTPTGEFECVQRYGYTLFPHLYGGRLSGFKFANGLVSFSVLGARTRRYSQWGIGPHDLEGGFKRLVTPVSPNTSWRTTIIEGTPPVQTNGIEYLAPDVLDNGTAADPMPDPTAVAVVDGEGADTSNWIIDGGRA